MKKIITCLIFVLTVLNVNAEVEITYFYPDIAMNTIEMGKYGESLVFECPFTLEYNFSSTEPVNLKLEVYVYTTFFKRFGIFISCWGKEKKYN